MNISNLKYIFRLYPKDMGYHKWVNIKQLSSAVKMHTEGP